MAFCKDSLAKATPLLLVNEEGKHKMETRGLLLQRHGNNHRCTHQGIHSSCLLLTNILVHMVGCKYLSYRHIQLHYLYLLYRNYIFKEWNKASIPSENKTNTTMLTFIFHWVMLKIRKNKSRFSWKYEAYQKFPDFWPLHEKTPWDDWALRKQILLSALILTSTTLTFIMYTIIYCITFLNLFFFLF